MLPDDDTWLVRRQADLDDETRIVRPATDLADVADINNETDLAAETNLVNPDAVDDETNLVSRESDETRIVGRDSTDETRIVSARTRAPQPGLSAVPGSALSGALSGTHQMPETPLGFTARYGVRAPIDASAPVERVDHSIDNPVVVLPGSAAEIRRAGASRARGRSLIAVGIVVAATVIVAAGAVVAITVVVGL